MKVLLSPDKFKGSLSAQGVCEAMRKGIHKFDHNIQVLEHPLADGGEGTLDILSTTIDLTEKSLVVSDPLFRPIEASYKISGNVAYIEMAAASGLPILKESERNALLTTTYGTGELILDAISNGADQIYLFVGGSATNDAGIGMAAALGYEFFDEAGQTIRPIGSELTKIASIKDDNLKFDPTGVEVFVVCDVKTKLYGKAGAAYIYGPQKGADEKAVKLLDEGLQNFSKMVNQEFDIELAEMEGGGAAGGIAAGAVAFLGAQLRPGIETIMNVTGYNEKLKNVDLIITGEGKLDIQTVHGKVIYGVNKASKNHDIPFAVICGIAEDLEKINDSIDVWKILQVKRPDVSLESAINEAGNHVEELAYELIKEFVGRSSSL